MAWSPHRPIVRSRLPAARRSRQRICGCTSMLIRGRFAPDSIGRAMFTISRGRVDDRFVVSMTPSRRPRRTGSPGRRGPATTQAASTRLISSSHAFSRKMCLRRVLQLAARSGGKAISRRCDAVGNTLDRHRHERLDPAPERSQSTEGRPGASSDRRAGGRRRWGLILEEILRGPKDDAQFRRARDAPLSDFTYLEMRCGRRSLFAPSLMPARSARARGLQRSASQM